MQYMACGVYHIWVVLNNGIRQGIPDGKVYIGYESGVMQCILRYILKGILLVKSRSCTLAISVDSVLMGIIYSLDASYTVRALGKKTSQ